MFHPIGELMRRLTITLLLAIALPALADDVQLVERREVKIFREIRLQDSAEALITFDEHGNIVGVSDRVRAFVRKGDRPCSLLWPSTQNIPVAPRWAFTYTNLPTLTFKSDVDQDGFLLYRPYLNKEN